MRERSLSGRGAPDELSATELGALQTNINYQFARALRNQAQCYTADSPDRANSLSRAVELLTPLAKMDVSDPAAWLLQQSSSSKAVPAKPQVPFLFWLIRCCMVKTRLSSPG